MQKTHYVFYARNEERPISKHITLKFLNIGDKEYISKAYREKKSLSRIRISAGIGLLNTNTGSQKTMEPFLKTSEGIQVPTYKSIHSQTVNQVCRQNKDVFRETGLETFCDIVIYNKEYIFGLPATVPDTKFLKPLKFPK